MQLHGVKAELFDGDVGAFAKAASIIKVNFRQFRDQFRLAGENGDGTLPGTDNGVAGETSSVRELDRNGSARAMHAVCHAPETGALRLVNLPVPAAPNAPRPDDTHAYATVDIPCRPARPRRGSCALL